MKGDIMIASDEIIEITYVEKYWEIDQEIFNQLKVLKDSNGFPLLVEESPSKRIFDNTLLGHKINIVGAKGIRIIFKFSDGSAHKVEINMERIQ